jgi:hypothetical protein
MSRAIDTRTLSRRIAEGESVGAIMLSLLSPAEQQTITRCAMVRSFDRILFDEHLQVGGPKLSDLLAQGLIEQIDDQGFWFRVAAHVRHEALNLWWMDTAEVTPEPLLALTAALADYYGSRWPVERLRQLVVCDVEAARALFDELFMAADHNFDLAGCQDVIDAVSDLGRARFLPHALQDRRDDSQRRVWARMAWITDFLRTSEAHFQPRKTEQEALIRLLVPGPSAPWLLQLHGDGGTGKTMLLREFMSRTCVRSEPLVACARVDGDAIDPGALLDCPALLLVEVAAQLNRQLPGGPFTELLNLFGSYRAKLRRLPHDDSAIDGREVLPEGTAAEIEGAFCRALAVRSRVVVAVDTLDDVVGIGRLTPDRLAEFIGMLSRVHKAVDAIRIVLSGRHDLGVVEGVTLPEKGFIDTPVGIFTDDEARSYLVERRGIAERDKVDAIIGKGEGMPILLAGFADEVQNDKSLTAKEIEQITGPQVSYMNDRVLDRIGDPLVRWCLRYSVVPPALSAEFFRNTMLQELRAAGPDDDLLGEAGRRHAGMAGHDWRRSVPGVTDEAGIERLWQSVVASANKTRWMSSDYSASQDLVIVNPKVLVALRQHVRFTPAFDRLHVRAIAHYQGLIDAAAAESDGVPEIWIDWIRRVIFHFVQLADPHATDRWRMATATARGLGRPDWVRALAEYALSPDCQEAGVADLAMRQLRYEAYLELARVLTQGAGQLPGGRAALSVAWPEDARCALAMAQQVCAEDSGHVRAVGLEAGLAALLAVAESDADALSGIEQALDGGAGSMLAPEACLARARGYARGLGAAEGPGRAEIVLAAYRQAREAYLADAEGVSYVNREAGQWLVTGGRPDLVLEWAQDADLAELRAEALLALGRPGSALASLPSRGSPRERYLAALAQLALRRPMAAIGEFADALPANSDGESVDEQIDRELVLARAYGELLEMGEARGCLSRAQSLVNETDERNNARIDTAAARLEMTVASSVKRAADKLDQEFASLEPGSPAWVGLQLARAELADHQGRIEDVGRHLQHAREALLSARAPASSRAAVALAGLAIRSPGWASKRRGYLTELIEDLQLVVPAARAAMVGGLRRCPPIRGCAADGVKLRKLVMAGHGAGSRGTDTDSNDQIWLNLTLAHLNRVIGDDEEYCQRRDFALLSPQADPFVGWELLATDARFGRSHDLHITAGHFETAYGNHSVLAAAFIAEWIDQYGGPGNAEVLDRRLEKAVTSLAEADYLDGACEARLREIQAKRAASRGDQETAANLAARANSIWMVLGTLRQVGPDGQAGRPRVEPDVVPDAFASALIYAEQGGATVHLARGPASPGGSPPGDIASARSDFATSGWWIDTTAAEWGSTAGERLGAGLQVILPASADGRQVDVHVEFPTPRLASSPWEVSVVDQVPLVAHPGVRYVVRGVRAADQGRRQVRYQQRLLTSLGVDVGAADGIAGPLYAAGVEEFSRRLRGKETPAQGIWHAMRSALRQQAKVADLPLNVLLVQPVVGGNLDLLRRLGERMRELARVYATAFGDAGRPAPTVRLVLREMSGGEVANLLWSGGERQDIDVLHVCTVMEATERMPMLGLDARGEPPLSAAEMDQIVARVSGKVSPLIILDVQAPPSPADVRRQLIMRNRFAHQLLALGNVDTILATGLGTRDEARRQWECIAGGLAQRLNAAEIARTIQRTEPEAGQEDALEPSVAFAGTAFFAGVRPDVLVEPGLFS